METLPRLWIPGPTHVRPELLRLCAEPMIGHRTPDMVELLARTDPHLPLLFGYDPANGARAAVASTSATGMMEAALIGLSGRRVLSVVGGAFAKRWRDIARGLGLDVVTLEIAWGEAPTAEQLTRALESDGPFDAITLVANETSTGVLAELDALAEARRAVAPEALLLVDAVTLAAGGPVEMDARGIDFAVTGSQKALALPPGLAPFVASARYLEQARSAERRGWYLDPVRLIDGHAAGKTPTTPAIPLLRALAQQLEDISAGVVEGGGFVEPADAWTARFDRHLRMRERVTAWAASRSLCPFPARKELNSPTVTCVSTAGPNGPAFDAADLCRQALKQGLRISNGYGNLKGRTFRIGHMGDHLETDLEHLLGALQGTPAKA